MVLASNRWPVFSGDRKDIIDSLRLMIKGVHGHQLQSMGASFRSPYSPVNPYNISCSELFSTMLHFPQDELDLNEDEKNYKF